MSTQTLLRNLRTRSALLRAVRDFFYAGEFLEIETPVKIPAPAPEEYIESVTAGNGEFLRTSPELAMKELLSLGVEKMFQIGSAFRAGEFGRKHREEFTILEYYAAGWDYKQLADFTARMMAFAAKQVIGRTDFDFDGRHFDLANVEYITVDEALHILSVQSEGISVLMLHFHDRHVTLSCLKHLTGIQAHCYKQTGHKRGYSFCHICILCKADCKFTKNRPKRHTFP